MFVLERLLDDLGKEAKDAPGWITLWTLCNVALYFIAELPIIGSIENERVTVATCASIVLFFIGDMVDIVCFPRGRDPERAEKLVRNAMMVSAAVGFFLLFSKAWVAGGLAWVPWLLLWPLHNTLAAARTATARGGPGDGSKTGWPWLVPTSLRSAQKQARDALTLQAGVYGVSKALAKRTGNYMWKPWLANETSKLIRSAVVPIALAALFLLPFRPVWGLAAIVSTIGLLFAYARLKAWHMRKLYTLASNTQPPPTPNECAGLSLVTWNGQPIAYCVDGKWHEVVADVLANPYPGNETLVNSLLGVFGSGKRNA